MLRLCALACALAAALAEPQALREEQADRKRAIADHPTRYALLHPAADGIHQPKPNEEEYSKLYPADSNPAPSSKAATRSTDDESTGVMTQQQAAAYNAAMQKEAQEKMKKLADEAAATADALKEREDAARIERQKTGSQAKGSAPYRRCCTAPMLARYRCRNSERGLGSAHGW